MKKMLLVCSCAVLLAVFGPIPAASASWWPWGHHHSKKANTAAPTANQATPTPAPEATASKPKQSHWPKFKHEKHQQPTGNHLYSVPGTVGWHHKGPGPAGAGS